MIRVRSRALVALAALVALPMAVQAQAADTRPLVAVLYFDNNSIGSDRTDYDGLGLGITDLLITDMAANQNLRVVERERIEAIKKEQDLVKSGAIDPATAVRIGKLLGARHMVYGGFMKVGNQMVLTARAVDVETGQITNPQKVQKSGDDVLAIISDMSNKLRTDMKLPALERRTGDAGHQGHGAAPAATQAGEKKVAEGKPAKLDLRTALLYSKALEAQDAGDRGKAVELYNQVLDKFPNLESARKNRDQLQASGE